MRRTQLRRFFAPSAEVWLRSRLGRRIPVVLPSLKDFGWA